MVEHRGAPKAHETSVAPSSGVAQPKVCLLHFLQALGPFGQGPSESGTSDCEFVLHLGHACSTDLLSLLIDRLS